MPILPTKPPQAPRPPTPSEQFERVMAADRFIARVQLARLGEDTSRTTSPETAANHAAWRDQQRVESG